VLSGRLDHHLAQHHGCIDVETAESLGVFADAMFHAHAAGYLVREHLGVYRSAQAPRTFEARAAAACMAYPGAAVSHRSGGKLWGLRRIGFDQRLHMTVPEDWVLAAGDVVCHRRHLPESETVLRADGIRVTDPIRTACDLAGVLQPGDLASVLEQVMDRHHLQMSTVLARGRAWARPGRKGSGVLLDVLGARPGGGPAGSHQEVVVHRALRRAGLGNFERQVPIEVEGGTVYVDLCDRRVRFVVEVDGRIWHTGDQHALDVRRDRLLRLAGYEVHRVAEVEVQHNLERPIRELVALYHLRALGTDPRHARSQPQSS
jgi:very-short-patch-repair endonuclease